MKKELTIQYTILQPSELSKTEQLLLDKAKEARQNAYSPYSNFQVGCSLLLENGEVFTGNNQENAAYPSGLCAERSTIYWVSANFPSVKIQKICIVGGSKVDANLKSITPPCGSCRQSLLEYETKQSQPIEIYLASLEGEIIKISSVKDLLPFSFDNRFL